MHMTMDNIRIQTSRLLIRHALACMICLRVIHLAHHIITCRHLARARLQASVFAVHQHHRDPIIRELVLIHYQIWSSIICRKIVMSVNYIRCSLPWAQSIRVVWCETLRWAQKNLFIHTPFSSSFSSLPTNH